MMQSNRRGFVASAICAATLPPFAASAAAPRRWLLLVARTHNRGRAAFADAALAALRAGRRTDSSAILFGAVIDDPGKPAGNATTIPADAVIAIDGGPALRDAAVRALQPLARSLRVLAVETTTFVVPRDRAVRVTTLLRRRAGVSHGDFVAHTMTVHGPLSRAVTGLDGYAMSAVSAEAEHGDPAALATLGEIDIVGEGWIGGGGTIPDSPARTRWLADGKASFGNVIRIVTRDTPVRARSVRNSRRKA